MSSRVIVLGTNHVFQGAKKNPKLIVNPEYRSYITRAITDEKIDFVFEEATGLGPTIAEAVAEEKLGKGHYLDVDPSEDMRKVLRIGTTTRFHVWNPMAQVEVHDFWVELILGEQQKRENVWLQAIQARPFDCGLLICGMAHLLSFGFRLDSAGYSAEARAYSPEHRICERTHRVNIPGLILQDRGTERPL